MRKTIILLLFIAPILSSAQSRPGFIYNYSTEYDITASISCRPYADGKTLLQDIVADSVYINAVGKNERQWLTIVDSALGGIDTTIALNDDTSSTYLYSYNQCLVQDDTTYFLFDCLERTPSGISPYKPINLLFVKMDKNYNFSSAKYLFEKDTLGVLISRYFLNMKYDAGHKHFKFFLMEHDTVSYHNDPILIQFDRQGRLTYFKKWDYTVHTQNEVLIRDFYNLGNGRYLLAQDITNDIYLMADTAESEVDTSYYKPEIRGLSSILERDNSLVLFGTSDGHKIVSFNEGKLQYTFLELDRTTLEEKSRHSYKLKDTLKYEIEAGFTPDKIVDLSDGDYIFTSSEAYYYNARNNVFTVSSIYRVDSMMNLVWSYKMADTLYNETMGGVSVQEIPGNPDELLWHCTVYASQTLSTPPSAWVMKFNVDGSDLGIGLEEEKRLPDFSLYPNPAGDVAFVLLPFVPSGESRVEVYSLTGQLVGSQTFTERDNLLKVSVNLPTGSYLFQVTSGGYEATKQLVVE